MGTRRFTVPFIPCTSTWNYWNNPPTTPNEGDPEFANYIESYKHNMINDIDVWSSMGADGISLSINIYKPDGSTTYVVKESLTVLLEMVNYSISIGLPVKNIKIHTNTSDFYESVAVATGTELTALLSNYESICIQVATTFKGKCSEILLYNEIPTLFQTNTTIINHIVTVCNRVKNELGYKRGISTLSSAELLTLTSTITSVCDFLGFSFYPFVTSLEENAKPRHGYMAFRKAKIVENVEALKIKFPTKSIYLTETGVIDYYIALFKTWQWAWGDKNINVQGEAQKIMYFGIFSVLNGSKLDGVFIWFETTMYRRNNLIEYYLKGDDYYEF